jgi:hypothetical protein
VEKIAANNCSQTLRQQLNALHDEWKQVRKTVDDNILLFINAGF